MKRFSAIIFAQCALLSFLVTPIASAGNIVKGNSNDTLQLSELIEEAKEKNPEIISAKERWQSALEIIEARRALPDPQVTYGYFIENVETRVGPQRHIFGARQKFPFYGKRGLRAELASKEAEALEATYEAVKQEVVRQVKKRYYDLFYVSKIMNITENEKSILKRFERIAMTKYETGKGNQQNILKVQVEISRLKDRLLVLADQKQTAEVGLNTLLNRPAGRPFPAPEQPKFRAFYYTRGELFRLAKMNRPELKAGIALIEKSDRALSLAEKNYYPDLTVGANYIEVGEGPLRVSDNGQDAFNVMLSVNLPVWRKKLKSQVASASRMIKARKSKYQAILNRTMFNVKDNYFRIRTARDTYYLYRNVLIPQAEQSMKSAEASYVTGSVRFLDLVDAERVLLRVQFGYWKAYTDYLKRIADMERAVGVKLPESGPEETPVDIKEE